MWKERGEGERGSGRREGEREAREGREGERREQGKDDHRELSPQSTTNQYTHYGLCREKGEGGEGRETEIQNGSGGAAIGRKEDKQGVINANDGTHFHYGNCGHLTNNGNEQ